MTQKKGNFKESMIKKEILRISGWFEATSRFIFLVSSTKMSHGKQLCLLEEHWLWWWYGDHHAPGFTPMDFGKGISYTYTFTFTYTIILYVCILMHIYIYILCIHTTYIRSINVYLSFMRLLLYNISKSIFLVMFFESPKFIQPSQSTWKFPHGALGSFCPQKNVAANFTTRFP